MTFASLTIHSPPLSTHSFPGSQPISFGMKDLEKLESQECVCDCLYKRECSRKI